MVRRSDSSGSKDCAPDPRWLTAHELATWLEVRRLLQLLPAALDAETQRRTGVTFFEYQILATLSESDRRTRRMSELAEVTSSSLSRLSHAVTRLEAKGLVVRQRCDGVGRSSAATLTSRGLRKLTTVAPDHVESVRTLVIDALSEDQLRTLQVIAAQLVGHLDTDATSR